MEQNKEYGEFDVYISNKSILYISPQYIRSFIWDGTTPAGFVHHFTFATGNLDRRCFFPNRTIHPKQKLSAVRGAIRRGPGCVDAFCSGDPVLFGVQEKWTAIAQRDCSLS